MKSIDTPLVVLDKNKLKRNITEMAQFSKEAGVDLRPHIKAHKTAEIALLQVEAGAKGITVAKLGEAEEMAKAGIRDIFIAYQIIGEEKIQRVMNLMRVADLTLAVDSEVGVGYLKDMAAKVERQIPVLMEVDTGLNRCGVKPGYEAIVLAKKIRQIPGLIFKGIFTHAGHAYGASSPSQVDEIGRQEGEIMADLARILIKEGIPVEVVSVGSTPTVKISGKINGVTEIRPGNYVFYDAMQVSLGVVPVQRCALSIYATVISKPTQNRVIIDAGSKTLSLDKGAHGNEMLKGFGFIKGYPHLLLSRLSEEHGIIEGMKSEKMPEIGDVLEIIPNHACTAVNLTDSLVVFDENNRINNWRVNARGKVQ